MSEELGEISRRILRHEGYKNERFDKKELAEEITDILYLTLKLANSFKIDLDQDWDTMWERYEKKTSRK
jgi:NTP pyrophosphatase (non-canonical NTP hydrolase)